MSFLKKRKKKLLPKLGKTIDTLPGKDEKEKLKASRRKAFKEKMKHLGKHDKEGK